MVDRVDIKEINEKKTLMDDIKRLMSPIQYSRPSYSSDIPNKVVDKLLIRLGIIAIIGLLGYIVIKDSVRNKRCICD